MSRDFYLSDTVISARQAEVFWDFGGVTCKAMHLKNLEANIEKQKEDVGQLGAVMMGHKTVGANGTGSMSVNYCSPEMRELIQQYVETGKDFWFDITVNNNDAASNAGNQVVIIRHCNVDKITLAKLDVNGGVLDEDIPFTFEDFYVQKPFTPFTGEFAVSNPLEEIKNKATQTITETIGRALNG